MPTMALLPPLKPEWSCGTSEETVLLTFWGRREVESAEPGSRSKPVRLR